MKYYLTLILFILQVFIVSARVFAEDLPIQKGDNVTLEQCINFAKIYNPNIGLGNNINNAYKSRIEQTKSAYLPQVNVATGYSRQNPYTNTPVDEADNQFNGSVGVNQLIYDFGKTPQKTKISKLNYNSSKSETENTIVNVVFNVKQAYYSALSAKISRDIHAQSIHENEKHLLQAKAFFQAGTKSKIDVTTAEVNLSTARLNFIKANNSYKIALSSLNNAIGLPEAPEYNIADTLTFTHFINSEKDVNTSNEFNISSKTDSKTRQLSTKISKFNIADNLKLNQFHITFEEALKKAFDARPDLKSLVIKQSSASESVNLVKKDYFPTVSGFANYGFGGRQFPLDNGWSVGANVNLPVFNGLLTKYQVAEARANLDIASSNTEILRQNIYFQVQQAYINFTETEKTIPIAYISVKQAKENLDLANGRYKVGVGNSIEVQDAEINYNNSQLSYAKSLYDYNIARCNLEKAMGVQ